MKLNGLLKNKPSIRGWAFATYLGSATFNLGVHMSNAMYSGSEAINHSFRSPTYNELMNYQRKCLDEVRSPWILVPGSAFWRSVEGPDLNSLEENIEIPLEIPYEEKQSKV